MWQVDGYLEVSDGALLMEGVSVANLAATYGTPLFVFSEARIRHNISTIAQAFAHPSRRTSIFYASKANGNLAILQTVRDTGINVEVNSGGELYKALRAGFAPEQVIYNGVAKTTREIDESVRAGLFCINVDSAFELGRIIDSARHFKRQVRVALRMVPEVAGSLHGGLATGTHSSKFGIAAEELAGVYAEALKYPAEIALVGLHTHVGAQITDARKYADGVRALAMTALALGEATGHRVESLNLGGGLPVAYLKPEGESVGAANTEALLRGGPTPLDMAQAAFEALDGTPGAEVFESLILEPGSSIVADSALLLTSVENAKLRPSNGDRWLLLDAGFNTLMDILGYNWYFHAVAASRANSVADTPYRLGGPLCDSGDVYHDSEGYGRLPDYRLLPAGIAPGDLIAFLDTGGYTLEQMNQYNGQPRAAAVMIRRGGQVQVIRERETYADLLAHDRELSD